MKIDTRTAILAVLFGGAFAMAPSSGGQTSGPTIAPVAQCADLVNLQIPGSQMTITKAEEIPTTPAGTLHALSITGDLIVVAIPPYCRADGVIDQRNGVDGKSYAIGFAIALPDSWNGRFLFQGGGGLNGSVNLPLGAQAAGDAPALARGFAVVSTDTGHKGAVFDGSFMKDQLASLNFAYLAVGRVAIVSKEIIAHYYGQPAKYSYYDGCSTGGREGMLMSQRYPTYFDGIISGDPAMRTGYSNIGLTYARKAFAEVAPTDASGKRRAERRNDLQRQGLRIRSEGLRVQGGREDGHLPHRSAGRGSRESVQRTEGFTWEPSVCAFPVGHRLHSLGGHWPVRRILEFSAHRGTQHDRLRAAPGEFDHRPNGCRC